MRKLFLLMGLLILLSTLNDAKKFKNNKLKYTKKSQIIVKQDATVTEEPDDDNEEDSDEKKFLPDITPKPTTTLATTTTTDQPITNFTSADLITEEINEAFIDYLRSMEENFEDFMYDTRERTDNEISSIYELLEKDELFNLFEGKCLSDQLTTFDQFEAALNGFVTIHNDQTFEELQEFVISSFNKFNNPFQEYVRAHLETPLTTALRYNKVDRSKSVKCANKYVPEIIQFIEDGYGDILECYFIELFYNETDIYQDIITSLYRETASYLTVCTNAQCFKKACWKCNLLVLRATKYACDAMTAILKNLKLEIDDIGKCVNNYYNSTFVSYTTGRDSLRSRILDCLR